MRWSKSQHTASATEEGAFIGTEWEDRAVAYSVGVEEVEEEGKMRGVVVMPGATMEMAILRVAQSDFRERIRPTIASEGCSVSSGPSRKTPGEEKLTCT
jgi:hypothetical protein